MFERTVKAPIHATQLALKWGNVLLEEDANPSHPPLNAQNHHGCSKIRQPSAKPNSHPLMRRDNLHQFNRTFKPLDVSPFAVIVEHRAEDVPLTCLLHGFKEINICV